MTCNISVWCEQIIVMYLYIKEENTAFHVLIVDGSLEYLVGPSMECSRMSCHCESLHPLASISYSVSCTLGIVIGDRKKKLFK